MRRTALLIGAETHGLTGVHNDVDTMADLLARRDFATVRCDGAQATRDGILDGLRRLVRDARHDDTVVVYYSGHGGLAVAPPQLATTTRAPAPRLRFLVPTDYDAADFCGITAPELSVLLARLTHVSANVTVIVDACYAAHMLRGEGLRAKALHRPAYVDVAEHLSRLRRHGLDPTIRHVLGNQDAVRIVACGPQQSAYEYTNDAGRRTGIFTESLALALTALEHPRVSWATLVRDVRRRVRTLVPQQRPEAEGPSLRLLFQPIDPAATATVRSLLSTDFPLGAGGPLGASVTVEWGRLDGVRSYPLPLTDAVMHVGDHVYVRVRNDGDTTVHVSLLGIDVGSRLSVLTSLDPSGIALAPGHEHVVGSDEWDGRLTGVTLAWSAGIDRAAPRPATLVLVVSATAADVSLLSSNHAPLPGDDSRPDEVAAPAPAPVEAEAEAFREIATPVDDAARCDLHPIAFRLDPTPRPAGAGVDGGGGLWPHRHGDSRPVPDQPGGAPPFTTTMR